MPRYFLTLLNGDWYRDDEGEMFENDADALTHARKVARELALGKRNVNRWRVLVIDEQGHEVGRVPLDPVK